ncbi:kinase-like domain-containing protein [Rhodocollybia butyracea]|uniref:Kinase-like domain-containing protein n=1 Tax=Rhodocollybia butyracea TaxID=206335 RepID=A0A9P5Q570_9AGAR|nr:kinase-like domain-containing protein [Rhodocollybia butyracea]
MHLPNFPQFHRGLSDRSSDYVLGAPIGFGASSIVYAAMYRPSHGVPAPCALKVLDLDTLPLHSWSLLQRETTLMSLSKHPNVLRVRGSWMEGHKLYIALRLMNKGSAADVMRYGWPGGLEEDVIKCILEQALQGLNYLHVNGFIHRDVKAANLLIDDDGTVLLGDLGVAADLSEDSTTHALSSIALPEDKVSSDQKVYSHTVPLPSNRIATPTPKAHKIGKRKSFVGTPCWMAPELIQGKQYDSSADIWSFGITALELTQGRPPRSREPPQKVLLKTIQEDPPSLDRDGGAYKYSKSFQEMISSCLVKDPSKRPTAAQLLQTPFFRGAKKKSYLINAILEDLPPLSKRQERRIVPNSQIYGTVDSWDFTMNSVPSSPTTLVSPKRHSVDRNMVFEMEGESLRHPFGRNKRFSGAPAHSTGSGSVEELNPATVEPVAKVSGLPDTFTTIIPVLNAERASVSTDVDENKSLPTSDPQHPTMETNASLTTKTLPIPIGGSRRPTQLQDNDFLLLSSPSSVMTYSTSPRSITSKSGTTSSSSSSRGGLWNKIKDKTRTASRVSPVGGFSHKK